MRVLMLSHMFPNEKNPQKGVFVSEQIKALAELGVSTQVISTIPWVPWGLRDVKRLKKYQGIQYKEFVSGVPVIRPRIILFPGKKLFYLSGLFHYLFCCRLAQSLIREQSFDLIHSHTIMPDGFASVLLGRKLKLPVICTIHGSDVNAYPDLNPFIRWATKWAIMRLDGCITVSQGLREKVKELCASAPFEVEVIYNGADPELFSPMSKEKARRILGISYNCNIILYVGNLVKVKGVDYLIDAYSKVKMQYKELCLYIVGDGEMRSDLEESVRRRLLSESVIFIGKRPHHEIPTWMSAADCLVMPSLNEGFPTLLSEAMLSKTPIVATSVGGIPEILQDKENGLIVPSKSANRLADAMRLMLEDKVLGRRLASRGRQAAFPQLTWQHNAYRTLQYYQSTLKSTSL